jgi:hypothetical protein
MSEQPEPTLPFTDGWPSRIDVGPGWYEIVAELAKAIETTAPGTTYHQVKEKMGGLRVYYETRLATDTAIRRTVDGLIRAAETRAGRTCDKCGQPGSPRNLRGLLATRCDIHAHRTTSA